MTTTYLITDGRTVKIGRSKNPEWRLRQLQSASGVPLRIVCIYKMDVERALHDLYDAHRLQGEWFSMAVLSFGLWLKGQCFRDDPIGDVANDAIGDKCFPWGGDYEDMILHISVNHNASYEAQDALKAAYHEWRDLMKTCRNAGITQTRSF